MTRVCNYEKRQIGGDCVDKNNKELRFIEQCYTIYEHKMYYIAYSILHDVGMSEDAVQEAFIRLMRSGKIFEDASSEDCQRYLYTIIKNVSLNSYRKNKRDAEWMYLADEETILQAHSDEDVCEINMEEMIELLPEKYAKIVRLLVIENMSVSEVANRLGIQESNVRKRFERAKKMMKKRSEQNEEGRFMYRTIHS